jgi:hypothetical protein
MSLLAFVVALAAQDHGQVPNDDAIDLRATIESREGKVTSQSLEEFQTKTLRDVGAAWIRFAEARVLDVRSPDEVEVLLSDGDRLRGRVSGGNDEMLELWVADSFTLSIPIEHMRGLVFHARLPVEGVAGLSAPAEGDRLYRRIGENLDRIDGAVEQFDDGGVTFVSVLGTKEFPWAEIGAVFVESFGDPEPQSEGIPVVCDLVDGGRLRGRLESLDRRGCRLHVSGSGEVALPLSALAEVSLDDGTIAFVSDLEPSSSQEGSPFGDELGMTWPHRMDQSVGGGPLVANGRVVPRGIGVHAPSRLTFVVDGQWDELRGSVVIDDDVLRLPARGSVIFRIHVDGELAWESGVVRGGMPPSTIPPVTVRGAREFTLECDMAGDMHVADRADWLRMVLVKHEE